MRFREGIENVNLKDNIGFIKMTLQPILVGVLLILNGPQSMVLGSITTENAKDDVKITNTLIEELLRYSKKNQIFNENAGNSDQELQDYVNDNNNIEDTIDLKDVNLAAADFDDLLEAVDVNRDSGQPSIEDPTIKISSPTTEPSHAPLPPQQHVQDKSNSKITVMRQNDFIFAAVVSACSVALFAGLITAGVCWYKLNKKVKSASDTDYPAYGVTGPTKERLPSPGDRKLAQSAQMYHYQHQKQQMIAMEKANSELKHDASEDDSDEENEEGDYTVYECPGLAPTGEMEVRNPLFTGDAQTPVNGQIPVPGLPDNSHDQQK